MRITFVLPSPERKPVGGFRVVYEYADALALRGHEVSLCYSLRLPFINSNYKKPFLVRYVGHHLLGTKRPGWFNFKSKIRLSIISEVSNKHIPDGDVVIATFWPTAYAVNELAASKGKKFYLIQHHEAWAGDEELVNGSYMLGLNNIVIAKWLKSVVEDMDGRVAAHIPNGVSLNIFKLKTPIEARDQLSVAMMYHEHEWKGVRDGIAALETVGRNFPKLKSTMFGVYPRPKWLPDWFDYVYNPPQTVLADIYNRNAVFVSPSWIEGFGLPGAEAMACGCALATTDSGGVRDYAKHEETALLSPPKDPEALSNNIIRLISDAAFRINMAKKGFAFIQNSSWEKAANKLEKVLIELQ